MKLIIDIPDEEYKQLHYSRKLDENLRIYILNGKPYEEPQADTNLYYCNLANCLCGANMEAKQ